MKQIATADIITAVRYIIDEQAEEATAVDTFEEETDKLILALAPRVLQMLMMSCPVGYLEDAFTTYATTPDSIDTIEISGTSRRYAVLDIPEDFLRIFSIGFKEWNRIVTVLSSTRLDENYALSNIGGTTRKPKAYLYDGQIYCFSFTTETATPVNFKYIQLPQIDTTAETLDVPVRLQTAFEYLLASEFLKVTGETDRSKALLENVKTLIAE